MATRGNVYAWFEIRLTFLAFTINEYIFSYDSMGLCFMEIAD